MPRRKALLIGINYYGTANQLNGCINDAMNLREYLVRDRGYSSDQHDMVVMTDDPQNRGTPFEPTGRNMLAAFQWLVTGNRDGDSVFLSYSGHGGEWISFIVLMCVGMGELGGCESGWESWRRRLFRYASSRRLGRGRVIRIWKLTVCRPGQRSGWRPRFRI